MLRADADPELRAFDPLIRSLHWLTVFLVAAAFVLALSIDLAPSKAAGAVIQLHRSIGVTVWLVTLIRFVWRQFSRFPNWPAGMPQLMRFAAHWSEYALYALLLIQPILGLLHTNAHGERVNLFFLGQPSPDRPGPPAREATLGSARNGRVPSSRTDSRSRLGRSVPPFLAP